MITVWPLNRHRLRTKNRIIPQHGTPHYHCYRLMQMFTTFLTFPIQCNFHSKRRSWSFSKQQPWQSWETLLESENTGPGLYKALTARALSHLCLSLALCVWWEVMVMVLLGRSGFWDASLTLRPGSISDHFNGQECKGCYPTPPNQDLLVYHRPPWAQCQQIHLHLLIAHWQKGESDTPLWNLDLCI